MIELTLADENPPSNLSSWNDKRTKQCKGLQVMAIFNWLSILIYHCDRYFSNLLQCPRKNSLRHTLAGAKMSEKLTDWPIDWPIDRLIDWSIGRLIDWLIDWLIFLTVYSKITTQVFSNHLVHCICYIYIYCLNSATIQFSIWDKPSLILQVTKDLKVQTFVLWSLCFTKKDKH